MKTLEVQPLFSLNVLVCEPSFFIVRVCYHPKRNLDFFRWWLTFRENRKGTDNSAVGPLKALDEWRREVQAALQDWQWWGDFFVTRMGKALNKVGPIQKLTKGYKRLFVNFFSRTPLWIWLQCFFGILFFGVSSLEIATWGVSKTNWTNVISCHITKKHRRLWGDVAYTSHQMCVFFLKDLLMSDRQRVSRREPVKGKEETPADVAYATLVAVYPEARVYIVLRLPRASFGLWRSIANSI